MAETEEGRGEIPAEGAERQSRASSTLWPILFAGGIAVLLVGVVTNWVVFGVGVAVAVVAGALWTIEAHRKPPQAADVAPVEEPAEEVEEEDAEPERYGRAKFLEISTIGLGGLIGLAVTVPIVGFAVAPSFIGQGDEDINLGPLENFPEGQFMVVTFESREREGEVSRQTAFVRNNGLTNNVPSFTIISNHCVHLGCPVQPGGPTATDEKKDVETDSGVVTMIPTQPASFVCPCHGGAYDIEGNRTAGPPVRALDRYEFSIIDNALVLGERFSVGSVEGEGAAAVITRCRTRFDPGQHILGAEGILYPLSPRGPC